MANIFFMVKCCEGLKNIILKDNWGTFLASATRKFTIRFKCRLFDPELCQDQTNLAKTYRQR